MASSIKVEIDLLNSGSWTDITTYVDAASIRRGRTRETDTISAGTLSLDLYNDGGRFTPGNTAGAFYPNIKQNRPLRVSMVGTATTAVFTGDIDSVSNTWSNGVRPMVTMSATDGFKGLQRRTSQSFYTETALSSGGGTAFYPLSEPAGADTFGSLTPSNLPGVAVQRDSKYGGGVVTPGQGAGFLAGASAATYCDFAFTGTGNTEHMTVIQVTGGLAQNGPVLPNTGNWTFGCWFKRASAPTDAAVMMYAGAVTVATDPAAGLQPVNASLFMDSTGRVNFSMTDTAGVTSVCRLSGSYADGVWHYATVSLASDKQSLLLFIDTAGTGLVMTNPLTSRFPNLNWIVAGGQLTAQNDSRYGWGGSLANLEFYATIDTTLAHAIRFAFGQFGFYFSSDTGSMVQNIAQNFGYVTGSNLIHDAGVTAATPVFDMNGSSYLDLLQLMEKTEQGLLYIDGLGRLVFRNRTYRVNQTSVFTLNAANQEVTPDFQTGVDDQLLFNDFAATRPGGAVIRVRDVTSTSIADNGVYTNSTTDSGADSILVTTDAEVRDYANFKVANYSQPKPRAPQVTVDLKRAPDLFDTVRIVDLGTRFTVTNLPSEAPASSMDFIAESVNWTFSGRSDTWTLTMDTSPADNSMYFRWDDAKYGQYDAGNAWFY